MTVCHQFIHDVPVSLSQSQRDTLVVGFRGGVLQVRSCHSLTMISSISSRPHEASPLGGSFEAGANGEDEMIPPQAKRRRLNDSPPSVGEAESVAEELVYLCPSPNSCCVSSMQPSREVDMYHLGCCLPEISEASGALVASAVLATS